MLAKHLAKSDRYAGHGHWTVVGQTLNPKVASAGQFQPTSANNWPVSTNFGRSWPDVGKHRPRWAKRWSTLAHGHRPRSGRTLGRCRSTGQHGPTLAEVRPDLGSRSNYSTLLVLLFRNCRRARRPSPFSLCVCTAPCATWARPRSGLEASTGRHGCSAAKLRRRRGFAWRAHGQALGGGRSGAASSQRVTTTSTTTTTTRPSTEPNKGTRRPRRTTTISPAVVADMSGDC